jgi:hypothetical protein
MSFAVQKCRLTQITSNYKSTKHMPSKLTLLNWRHHYVAIVRLKRGGTSLREKAGFKGKQANGVSTQLMKRERQVTACTALLPCYYYDVYTSPASAWLSWHPRLFEWTGPFLWKTKSSLCACAITFQTHSTTDILTQLRVKNICFAIAPYTQIL